MKAHLRSLRRRILRIFAVLERPAAWGMMFAGVGVLGAVLFGVLATGDFKAATLLIAADLVVSGFSAVQTTEEDEDNGTGDISEGGRNSTP